MRQLLASAYALLSDSYKRRIVPLVLLLAFGSLLDFFSLTSFLPVILLIINPQQTTHWLTDLLALTGFKDPADIGATLTFVVLLFILIKTRIQVWITFRKASYAYGAAADLASAALTQYLNASYSQFTHGDHSREVNRIYNLPLIFANNIIIPIGTILSEAVVAFLLLSCLAWFDYKIFLFLSILLFPAFILYRSKRKKITLISEQLKNTIPLLLKYALQAVESLLEIRIHRKESYFKNRFNQKFRQLEKTFITDHTNSTSANRITELIAALCVGALLLYALLSHQTFPNTMILLTGYAGASFRIIPSINRIFASFLQIRTNEYALQELKHSLSNHDDYFTDENETLPFKHSIELRNINFSYSGTSSILKDASLTVSRREKILLTGKSGSGKTSLLLIFLRLVTETSGEIFVDGSVLEPEDTLKWRRLFGYVPQSPSILDASIAENIAFGVAMEQINYSNITELIVDLDLQQWLSSLPNGLNTIIGEKGVKISGGQRQRLAIARTLYHGAEILLLDEITNQLDKQTRNEIIQTLNKKALQDKTIIMVSHHIEESDFFNSIYELQEGRFIRLTQSQKTYSKPSTYN